MARLRWVAEKISTLRRRRRLPMDDTRAWVTMANPGMLEPGNLYLFDHCIREMPSQGAVIEIGSFCGLSLNHILLLMREHSRDSPVFSADAWEFEGFTSGAACLDGTEIPALPFQQHIVDSFRRNVEFFSAGKLPHHIRLNSDEFFRAWNQGEVVTDFFGREVRLGGPISFAYVDGDHSYEQSLKDFENIDRHLQVGGFVIFDDSADWTDWGSHRTAREAAARSNYTLVERAPNYCVRKIAT